VACPNGSPRPRTSSTCTSRSRRAAARPPTIGTGCSGTIGRCAPSTGERSISSSLADRLQVVVEKIQIEIKSHGRGRMAEHPLHRIDVRAVCRSSSGVRPPAPAITAARSNHARRAFRLRMTVPSGERSPQYASTNTTRRYCPNDAFDASRGRVGARARAASAIGSTRSAVR
jgi:hypothetical protein